MGNVTSYEQKIEAAKTPQKEFTCPKCGRICTNLPNHLKYCTGDNGN